MHGNAVHTSIRLIELKS